jgi:hypothetical protein
MSLIDQIINDTAPVAPIQPATMNTFHAAIDTDTAVRQFGRSIPFRGQLRDVRNVESDRLLGAAGLAWNVHTMPVAAVGKRETRTIPGYQALVRGDNGETLSVTSDKFKAHQNADIMEGIQSLASAGDAKVCYAGPIDDGRKVVAVAQLAGEFTLPNERGRARDWNGHSGNRTPVEGEDQTALFAVISGGHEPGTPMKVRGMAFRKWCGNGAFFTVGAAATFTCTHRVKIGTADMVRLQRTYESIRAQFETYGNDARDMQRREMNLEQSRLYIAELLLLGATDRIAAHLAKSSTPLTPAQAWDAVAQDYRGKLVIDALVKESVDAGVGGFARQGKQLLDAIVNQDGANGANLWSGYNGVTWHVDHVRGRSAESGVDGALFGAGAALKERALVVARQFVH